MRKFFTTVTEIRTPDGRLEEADFNEQLAQGFTYKYGKFIRKHTEYLPVEAYKTVVNNKAA